VRFPDLRLEEMATYDAGDKFDRSVAEGFIKVWGMPYQGRQGYEE